MDCRPFSNTERSADIPPDESCSLGSEEMSALNIAIDCWVEPQHPTYTAKSSRLRTFYNWPHQMNPSPTSPSEAGFFFTGKHSVKDINLHTHTHTNDGFVSINVIFFQERRTMRYAFYVEKGLRDWKITDDP
jgi:hypothetical protein